MVFIGLIVAAPAAARRKVARAATLSPLGRFAFAVAGAVVGERRCFRSVLLVTGVDGMVIIGQRAALPFDGRCAVESAVSARQ